MVISVSDSNDRFSSFVFGRVVFHLQQECFVISSTFQPTEAATGGVLSKKVLSEILQNSQENTYTRVSFSIKLQA